jgi:hypothetical protein
MKKMNRKANSKRELLAKKMLSIFEERALSKILLIEKRLLPIGKDDLRKELSSEYQNLSKYFQNVVSTLSPVKQANMLKSMFSNVASKIKEFSEILKREDVDEKTFDKTVDSLEPWYNLSIYLVNSSNKLKNIVLKAAAKDKDGNLKKPENATKPLDEILDQATIEELKKSIIAAFNESEEIYEFISKSGKDDDEEIKKISANLSKVLSAAGLSLNPDQLAEEFAKIPFEDLVEFLTQKVSLEDLSNIKFKSVTPEGETFRESDAVKKIKEFLYQLKNDEKDRKKALDLFSKTIKEKLNVQVDFQITKNGTEDIKNSFNKLDKLLKDKTLKINDIVSIISQISKTS